MCVLFLTFVSCEFGRRSCPKSDNGEIFRDYARLPALDHGGPSFSGVGPVNECKLLKLPSQLESFWWCRYHFGKAATETRSGRINAFRHVWRMLTADTMPAAILGGRSERAGGIE